MPWLGHAARTYYIVASVLSCFLKGVLNMRDVDTLNGALMIKGSELVALPLNSFFINKIGDIHRIAAVGRENYVTELYWRTVAFTLVTNLSQYDA